MDEEEQRGADRRGEETAKMTLGLADDELYRVLASRPRRRVLYYLSDVESSTVAQLAEVLVGWETGGQDGMAGERAYERTEIALRHSHLPALADAGLLTYDPGTGAVAAEPLDAEVSDLLAHSIAAETA